MGQPHTGHDAVFTRTRQTRPTKIVTFPRDKAEKSPFQQHVVSYNPILKARRVCFQVGVGNDEATRKKIDPRLTGFVGSHASFVRHSHSTVLVVDISMCEPRFADVIASVPQLTKSSPVNAVAAALGLVMPTCVASLHHALRLSATPGSTLP